MKNIFFIAMIVVLVLVSGCGSKYSDETLIVDYALWAEDKENVPDMLDAINTHDLEFLAQQVVDGKLKHADKETKISVTDEFDNGKIVEIKFLQGRYKNKVGYTLAEFVRDVGKEREQEKINQEQKAKAEKKRLEEEQAKFEKAKAEEKSRIEQLVAEGIPEIQSGVKVVCSMSEGTGAYQKLIGKTNLPEGMRLQVVIANVKKELAVQHDGTFSVLFERSIIPVGEQDIVIRSFDKTRQPAHVQQIADDLLKEKRIEFLGKELYVGKIGIQ